MGLLAAEAGWWADRVGDHFAEVDVEALAALGFQPGIMDRAVRGLSSGERQRLALLRLLANRPEALLLDEPTANLDGEMTARVEALIEDYRRRHGAPVLWVSHDPAQARRVAGRRLRIADDALVPED